MTGRAFRGEDGSELLVSCAECFEESNRLQEQIKKNLEAIGYASNEIAPAISNVDISEC